MKNDVYRRLARHLDRLPGGFPPTADGVELRILRRLFTPEEAGLALHLTLIPEEPRVIARRIRTSPEEAARRLEAMARKGLIYRYAPEGRPWKYQALQYVIGIWEFHVNDLDPELIRDMEAYLPTLFNLEVWKKTPQLRTIPVDRSIQVEMSVWPYEKAREMVQAQKKFLVAPCICRRERTMMGEGCDKPEEACLVFGSATDYYRRNGLGRMIDLQETFDIIERADKEGLVLQPSNARNIVNICCCCGCCCGVLRTLKRHPEPASLVASAFVAALKTETCKGCGLCVRRCQMKALSLEGDTVALDTGRCIGCGLCVTTCPTQSLTLERKPEGERPVVPENMIEAYTRLVKERRKLGPTDLVRMRLKSKLDRLLAAR